MNTTSITFRHVEYPERFLGVPMGITVLGIMVSFMVLIVIAILIGSIGVMIGAIGCIPGSWFLVHIMVQKNRRLPQTLLLAPSYNKFRPYLSLRGGVR